MKILRRPGMPSKTEAPAPRGVRCQAAEIIRTGRYDEEELEDALVLIGGYLWATPANEEDVTEEEEEEDDLRRWRLRWRRLNKILDKIRVRRIQVEKPWFIGRQMPAGDAGTLDLIGPQRSEVEGALTIYELKAREIRPADLAQVESYRVALEELSADDLAWAIATNSGRQGIPRNWDPAGLRGSIESAQDREWLNDDLFGHHDPAKDADFRRINCAVVGRAWKRPVSRLANSMGIELIHIPELMATALEEIARTKRDIAKEEETQRTLEAMEEENGGG